MNELPNPAMDLRKTLGVLGKEAQNSAGETSGGRLLYFKVILEVIWFVLISDLKSKQRLCHLVT